MNGLEVNRKLGHKIAAKMADDGFVAPELNANAANAAQAEGAWRKR
jgi:hypothetical protein